MQGSLGVSWDQKGTKILHGRQWGLITGVIFLFEATTLVKKVLRPEGLETVQKTTQMLSYNCLCYPKNF